MDTWQKETNRNIMCLMDATYKTTLYDLPLFFICVCTNIGYCGIAEFIVQSEAAEHIQEAFEVLRRWNPEIGIHSIL